MKLTTIPILLNLTLGLLAVTYLPVARSCVYAAESLGSPVRPIADELNKSSDYAWFLQGRFGMFIHFGLYTNAARHEWVMTNERMSPQNYRKYFEQFNPDLFDARAWARAARAAGAKYVVLTTKHHEGFCLYDSRLTDYKITNTSFGRDLVRECVDAFRAEGLRIGFYYSLIDWYHPDFPLDGNHPMRDDMAAREREKHRSIGNYVPYLHGQIRELLTNYGKIDYIWFDYSYSEKDWGWAKGKGAADWRSNELVTLVHELQPGIVLNDRLGLERGGVSTPEQYQPRHSSSGNSDLKLSEACHTMNGSWGYDRDNLVWKSAETLVHLLIESVSKGHNLLLNVGPNGRGEFDPRSLKRLSDIGEWMRLHSRTIYEAGPSTYPPPDGCRFTQSGNRLYLHLFNYPFRTVHLEGFVGKVRYTQFVHDNSELRFKEPDPQHKATHSSPAVEANTLEIILPTIRPDVLVPVVEIVLR